MRFLACTCTVHVIVCLFGSSDKNTETKKAEEATAYDFATNCESDEYKAVSRDTLITLYDIYYPHVLRFLTVHWQNATVPGDEADFLA